MAASKTRKGADKKASGRKPSTRKPTTRAASAKPASGSRQSLSVRPLWAGTITFGLVSVPVEMFPAIRSEHTSLRMLSPEGAPLRRRYFSAKTGKDLKDDEMIRGYEFAKDRFVVVTDQELEKLAPEKSRDIDMRLFVEAAAISPIYYERGYYLTPGGNSQKAYRLLAKTLEDSERAGVGTFVMRGKEYLVAISAENGILRAQTLRFADEIRSPSEVGLPEVKKMPKASVSKFEKLIARHSSKTLLLRELKNEEGEGLLKLVKSKERRKKDVVKIEEAGDERDDSNVVDIMEVLKQSLAARRAS